MKKVATLSVAVLVLGVWSLACTTVVIKEDRGPEILLPGEFIESVDADTIRVKCQGTGVDLNAAIFQARKGCVEWVVNTRLAQTPGEKQAYKASQAQVFAQLDKYIGIPGPASRSGHDKGVKKRHRLSDTKIKVELIEDVQQKMLQEDLVAMGVLKSGEDMLDAVGNPTLMVFPSKANKGKKNRKIMEDLVNSYLTKSQWEVLSPKGMADLNKLVEAIGEVSDAEEDEAATLAMAVGADVYITFEANKKKVGNTVAYEVGINSYETTTSQMLSSETALSAPRSTMMAGEETAAMMEGLNDAMGKSLPQITGYWKKDAPKGSRFYVVFKNTPKKADMKMGSVLKKVCTKSKLVTGTSKTAAFRVQCKLDNLELAEAIDEGITAKLGGADYEFAAKNKNNLIVIFK